MTASCSRCDQLNAALLQAQESLLKAETEAREWARERAERFGELNAAREQSRASKLALTEVQDKLKGSRWRSGRDWRH